MFVIHFGWQGHPSGSLCSWNRSPSAEQHSHLQDTHISVTSASKRPLSWIVYRDHSASPFRNAFYIIQIIIIFFVEDSLENKTQVDPGILLLFIK